MKASEMTPEQIRVRCCEIEGIEPYRFEEDFTQPPDYTNSIDAINAAVLRMDRKKRGKWVEQLLSQMQDPESIIMYDGLSDLITAFALDRAKAFVAIYEK